MRERDPPLHPHGPLPSPASAGEGLGVRVRSCGPNPSGWPASASSRPRPLPQRSRPTCGRSRGSVGGVLRPRRRAVPKPWPSPGAARHPLPLMREREPLAFARPTPLSRISGRGAGGEGSQLRPESERMACIGPVAAKAAPTEIAPDMWPEPGFCERGPPTPTAGCAEGRAACIGPVAAKAAPTEIAPDMWPEPGFCGRGLDPDGSMCRNLRHASALSWPRRLPQVQPRPFRQWRLLSS